MGSERGSPNLGVGDAGVPPESCAETSRRSLVVSGGHETRHLCGPMLRQESRMDRKALIRNDKASRRPDCRPPLDAQPAARPTADGRSPQSAASSRLASPRGRRFCLRGAGYADAVRRRERSRTCVVDRGGRVPEPEQSREARSAPRARGRRRPSRRGPASPSAARGSPAAPPARAAPSGPAAGHRNTLMTCCRRPYTSAATGRPFR